MKRLRRRDVRASRQIAERERDAVAESARTDVPLRPKARSAEASSVGVRSGETLASMQMRTRVLEIIVEEAERLEGAFGRDDEAATVRDIEAEVRKLPPMAALETGDVEDLVTEVAISITYALEATAGMPIQRRVEEMARAALFLPSRLTDGRD